MTFPARLLCVVAIGCASLSFAQQAATPKSNLLDPPSGEDQSTGGRPNLLSNPSFEAGQTGWEFSNYAHRGTATIDTVEMHLGNSSIRIDNPAGDDSLLMQTVKVKPKTHYRMSGYIKLKDIVGKDSGATLSLQGSFEKSVPPSTKNWTKVAFEFDSGAMDSITIGPRLGFNSALVVGTAWFDDLALVELGPSRSGPVARKR
jgi:Carbohydrate binding domain